MKARALAAIMLAALAVPQPVTAQTSAEVGVRNNAFEPILAEVDPGGSVTWRLFEGEHTVTSDVPGSFDSGPMVQLGERFTFTVPGEDAWIYYHCAIHGSPGDGSRRGVGMWGAIKVGDPPLSPEVAAEVRAVPTNAWPSLNAALTGLNESGPTQIELAPGTYQIDRELTPATLGLGIPGQPLSQRFALTIRGSGDGVVIEGGVAASLDGLHLDNLTVTNAPFAGVLFWRGMVRWSIDRIDVPAAGRYGVRVERDARRGRIGEVHISGASIAAISVEGCVECDILVERVSATRSLAGLSALNAGTLVVLNSSFADNGVGIALKTSAGTEAPVRGAHLWGNSITNSIVRQAPQPPPSPSLDLPVGAGIWLAGASFATVEANIIDVSSFGFVVTGPARAVQVIHNVVTHSMEADIAWDGVGADVCFEGNEAPNGGEPSSMPPAAQTIYSCALPVTLGVPMPLVTARLVAWGVGGEKALRPTH